jgi:hypothetical protein
VAGAICQLLDVTLAELVDFSGQGAKLANLAPDKQDRLDALMDKNNQGKLRRKKQKQLQNLVHETQEITLHNARILAEQQRRMQKVGRREWPWIGTANCAWRPGIQQHRPRQGRFSLWSSGKNGRYDGRSSSSARSTSASFHLQANTAFSGWDHPGNQGVSHRSSRPPKRWTSWLTHVGQLRLRAATVRVRRSDSNSSLSFWDRL